ncbi:MAG TPA: polyphosphate kinase 2 family protein [Methyloceanibacter sp.]|jgi:PPK2 family polyphosphate:nucleotide phosphotransferase|nr:polyphosphate kinase 2 family protein [Methyloceanibacter sp.]
MLPSEIIDRFRVTKGSGFKLADYDPDDTCGLDIDKKEAKDLLDAGVKRLAALQERLYADDRRAILAILQGIDTSGKDGVIKHVMSGVNPQGCEVHSFKAPSENEIDHDFLWRTTLALPPRGKIGIFNRSYYEETIVVRVHPELLQKQRLPEKLITDDIWSQRFEDISNFERYLAHNGIVTLKFFLNISKQEQLRRLLARIDDPEKRWKFQARDVEERKLWDEHMDAYEQTIRNTSTKSAPWHVVPADHKWFTRLVVAATLVERMEALDLKFPKFDDGNLDDLAKIRAELAAELPPGKKS